jgi:hypothetical protein
MSAHETSRPLTNERTAGPEKNERKGTLDGAVYFFIPPELYYLLETTFFSHPQALSF